MVNNSSLHIYDRLAAKQLDSQFVNEMIDGLQCSQFEATAILDTVYKVYAPYFQTNGTLKPGQIYFQVVSIDNSPSVSLAKSKQITVTLTLDDPKEDLSVRKLAGVAALRCHRLLRVCTEAYMQGGLLTVEDLAFRLFNCGQRTICRDLQALKKKNISVPLRSTIKDMGRTISHRTIVVKQWLLGKEYSEISRDTFHSIQSVKNYIDKFKRVIALSEEQYDIHSIAFLVKVSAPLVSEYFTLYKTLAMTPHRRSELELFLKKNSLSAATKGVYYDS